MSDFPPGVLDAVAQALHEAGLLNNAGYIPGDEHRAAEVALTAAEAIWPHAPPGRDPASTTAVQTGLRWAPPVRNPDRPPVPKYGAAAASPSVLDGIGFTGTLRKEIS